MNIRMGVFVTAALMAAAMASPARAEEDCCKAKGGESKDCCAEMKKGAAGHEGHGEAKKDSDRPGKPGERGKHGKGKKMKMGHRPPGPPPGGPHGEHGGPPPPPPGRGHGEHGGPPPPPPPGGGHDEARRMLHREMQQLRGALHKAIDDAFKKSLDRWDEARPRIEEKRLEFHRKLEGGREKMGEARERAEKFREWMEREAGRAPEQMKKFREEAEKRFEGFGRHLRDRIEESGKRGPEGMKEFRERLERRMEEFGKRFHDRRESADAKGDGARVEREVRVKLRGPDGETRERHGDGFEKMRQGAEEFALKFLQTPQGQDMARESMRFMRDAGERIGRNVEELQGENKALQKKLEELQKRLGELEKAGK